VIPALQQGLLPPGIHAGDWKEVEAMFGITPWRLWLLQGLRAALAELARVGCTLAYLDGSFVTDKAVPADYDLCWEMSGVDLAAIDPVFLDLAPPRASQKARYRGDLLPNVTERSSAMPFIDFFQIDRNTGNQKGIVVLDPRRVP
jgi:hypothetical protein